MLLARLKKWIPRIRMNVNLHDIHIRFWLMRHLCTIRKANRLGSLFARELVQITSVRTFFLLCLCQTLVRGLVYQNNCSRVREGCWSGFKRWWVNVLNWLPVGRSLRQILTPHWHLHISHHLYGIFFSLKKYIYVYVFALFSLFIFLFTLLGSVIFLFRRIISLDFGLLWIFSFCEQHVCTWRTRDDLIVSSGDQIWLLLFFFFFLMKGVTNNVLWLSLVYCFWFRCFIYIYSAD